MPGTNIKFAGKLFWGLFIIHSKWKYKINGRC